MQRDDEWLDAELQQWRVPPASNDFAQRIVQAALLSEIQLKDVMAVFWLPQRMVALLLMLTLGVSVGWNATELLPDDDDVAAMLFVAPDDGEWM